MARAFQISELAENQPKATTGEWQALRGELMALLDQVETRYGAVAASQPAPDAFSQRLQDLRHQVGGSDANPRHREALKSVKRAVDRFSDRDDVVPGPHNPQDMLKSAIAEIRNRQHSDYTPPAPRRSADAPRFDDLALLVGGLTNRLEGLEVELKSQRATSGSVKEVASQVAQLTHVVELLAGAVGETGQVKRLEAQIAGLADMLDDGGAKADLSLITNRLDEVSATVGRLADIALVQGERDDAAAQNGPRLEASMETIERSVRNVYDRIDSIERNVALSTPDLERLTTEMAGIAKAIHEKDLAPEALIAKVDAIALKVGLIGGSSADISGLKTDLADLRTVVLDALEPRFTKIETQLDALVQKVDAGADGDQQSVKIIQDQLAHLVARMDETGAQLNGLAKLYEAPDYDALALVIAEKTSEAIARRGVAPTTLDENSLGAIEERMRALLDGSYQSSAPDEFIDMRDGIKQVDDRLARLEAMLLKKINKGDKPVAAVAVKAPETLSAQRSLDTMLAALSAKPFAAVIEPVTLESEIGEIAVIEAAASELVADHETTTSEQELADAIEAVVAAITAPVAPIQAEPVVAEPAMADVTTAEITEVVAVPVEPKSAVIESRDRDTMPTNPADDLPPRDTAFVHLDRLVASAAPNMPSVYSRIEDEAEPEVEDIEPASGDVFDDRSDSDFAKLQAGTATILAEAGPQRPNDVPRIDPATVVMPPRPRSSFDDLDNDPFAPQAERVTERVELGQTNSENSQNTFIEAARRLAQRQTAAREDVSANSIIGRALSRFGTTNGATGAAETETAELVSEPVPKADKKRRWKKQPVEAVEPSSDSETMAEMLGEDAPQASFLKRYRRPLLLAAGLVVVSLLALNLVMQRGATALRIAPTSVSETVTPAAATPAAATPSVAAPVQPVVVAKPEPRAIALVDSSTTGSITPVTPAEAGQIGTPAMPAALSTASLRTAVPLSGAPVNLPERLPETIADSPVKLDLPIEGIGPLELRQAAADGNARAQFEVAAIFSEGHAVPEDFAAAAVWYERAAAQGFAPAQYRIGNLYENGKGVTKDLEVAKLWYQRAAEAGNRMSMHNLAALYASGQLGEPEYDTAAQWFEQAANLGMTDSQFNLGMLYARGLGVEQNLNQSFKWFSLAAKAGDVDAAKARDDMAASLSADAATEVAADLAAWKPAQIDLAANFAPIGTWTQSFDTGEAITRKEVVTRVQQVLAKLGFDVGTPDGMTGPKTADAIKAFERATGMSEKGAINPRLLAVLGSQPV